MGLFDSIGSYIDARKRVAARNLRDVAADPGGMFGTWGNQVREDLTSNMQQMGAGVTDRGLLSQSIAAAMGPAGNAPMGLLGHTVYHGSPHKFDKFDASKIGTGEGAQAYGHGLYLAETPEVAGGYARGLSNPTIEGRAVNLNDPREVAANEVHIQSGNMARAADRLYRAAQQRTHAAPPSVAKQASEILDAILENKSIKAADRIAQLPTVTQGNLYKVDLPDEWLPKMLDWDKPLSQQPETVRAALNKIGAGEPPVDILKEADAQVVDAWNRYQGLRSQFGHKDPRTGNAELAWMASQKDLEVLQKQARKSGKDLYYDVAKQSQESSRRLLDAGIPGIRYLDGGSRSAGDGTYNYVVFPGMEGLLKILERQ